MKKSKNKVVKEDAVVGAEGASAGSGDIQSSNGISTNDILGKCDHGKNGFMSKDCFHVPAKVKTPLKRWEVANGGSKRKHTKSGKIKRYAYEQGMKVIQNLFESDINNFQSNNVMQQLSTISTTLKTNNDIKNIINDFENKKTIVLNNFQDLKYNVIKKILLDFVQFIKDINAQKYNANWFITTMLAVAIAYVLSMFKSSQNTKSLTNIINGIFAIKMIHSVIKDEFNNWKTIRSNI